MLGQAHHFNAYAPERVEREKIQYGIDRYVNESNRVYGVIDRRLKEAEWIAAGEYTIADMAIMPWLRDPAKQGIDIANYPNLERWRDKIWQRPQVVKALEDAGIVFLDSERGEGVMLVRGAAEKSRK